MGIVPRGVLFWDRSRPVADIEVDPLLIQGITVRKDIQFKEIPESFLESRPWKVVQKYCWKDAEAIHVLEARAAVSA